MHGLLFIHAGHQQAELLATEARDQVFLARVLGDRRGHRAQRVIAGLVAMGIVDVLEVVDIDHRHRHLLTIQVQLRQLALALFQEAAAIGQAGQEIAGGQVLQGADQLQLVHVLRDAAEELLAREGLAQEIVGAVLEEARDQRRVGIAGDPDHRQLVA